MRDPCKAPSFGKLPAAKSGLSELEQFSKRLRALGWRPSALIDYGVEQGNARIYSMWQDIPLVLMAASAEALVYTQQVANKIEDVFIFFLRDMGKAFRSACPSADEPVSAKTNVTYIHKVISSNFGFETREMTCDEAVARAGVRPPFLFLARFEPDGEGALDGATNTIERSEMCFLIWNGAGVSGAGNLAQAKSFLARSGFVHFGVYSSGPGIDDATDLSARVHVLVRAKSSLERLITEARIRPRVRAE